MAKGKNFLAIALTCTLLLSSIQPEMVTAATKKFILNRTACNLYVGSSVKLRIKGNVRVRWKSLNKKIATVNKKGKVTGKKAGTVKIRAYQKGTKKYKVCRVHVGKYLTKLTVNSASSVILKAGGTSQIRSSVSPKQTLTKELTYKSSNTKVAQVSNKGVIKAIDSGLTDITITSNAITKKKKKLSKKIHVFVSDEVEDTSTPVPTVTLPDAGSSVIDGSIVIITPPTQTPRITVTPTVIPTPTHAASAEPTEVLSTPTPTTGENQPAVTPTSNPTSEPTNAPTLVPTNIPTSEPTNIPTATPTQRPQTIQDYVNAIPSPSTSTAIAARFVVSSSSGVKTLYFLNPAYVGNLTLSFFGKSFSSSRNMSEVISLLVDTESYAGWKRDASNARVLYIKGGAGNWQVWLAEKNAKVNDKNIVFTVYKKDTLYGSPYPILVAEGDTTQSVQVG